MIKIKNIQYRFNLLSINYFSWLFGLIPAIAIIMLLPNIFVKYQIKTEQKYNAGKDEALIFYEDIDGDGIKDKLQIYNHREKYATILFWKNNAAREVQLRLHGKMLQQEDDNFPIFCDVNNDGFKEVFVFTQSNDSIFINPLGLLPKTINYPRKFVTTIGLKNDKDKLDFILRPIINHDYNADGSPELYFNINGGYSLYPRRIYAYDFTNDTIISSINSASQHLVTPIITDSGKLFFISTTPATNNCPVDFPYQYSDSLSWLFVFNDSLGLKSNPISFVGKSSQLLGPILYENEYQYYVLNTGNNTSDNYFFSANLKGEILRKKKFLTIGQKQQLATVTIKDRTHYIFFGSNNNVSEIFEYMPDKMTLEQNRFTRKLPKSTLIPFEIEKNKTAYIGNNFIDNKSGLFLDDFAHEVSLNVDLVLKPYSFYVQTKQIDKGIIIIASNGEYLYTFLLTENKYYPIRYIIYFLIYLINVGLIYIPQYFQKRIAQQRKKLNCEISSLQLKIVSNQLDPHFTFNALNVVSAKILKGDRFEAYDLMNNFSGMMRSSMLFAKSEDWNLSEELKFINQYLEFMKVRFKNFFSYTIKVDEDIFTDNILIPRLLVQNFIENTVKHAFTGIDYEGKLTIEVKNNGKNTEVKITDNGIGREKGLKNAENSPNKSGLGINLNTKQIELYNKLHKTSISFEFKDLIVENVATGTSVSIIIPILQ